MFNIKNLLLITNLNNLLRPFNNSNTNNLLPLIHKITNDINNFK